ncbi:TPA: DUF1090 family protein, partial [Salmonella enterica subsp. enterica serovar Duisburg]|nr:DUF1090 family protein [Salmonella enterica subsp. enterica serovar Duisburg]
MKYIKLILTPTFILLLSAQSQAAAPVGCAAKKQEVENQITYAREHNNTHQIAGLQNRKSKKNGAETKKTGPGPRRTS